MRWSQTYKARSGHHDTIDTVDTMGAKSPGALHSVNTVKSVTSGNGGDMAARAAGQTSHSVHSVYSVMGAEGKEAASLPFINDPAERAAIQAEAMPVRHLRPRAAGQGHPKPGDYCGCCKGSLWWTEIETPKGWRCCMCHPPAHLEPGQFRAVAT